MPVSPSLPPTAPVLSEGNLAREDNTTTVSDSPSSSMEPAVGYNLLADLYEEQSNNGLFDVRRDTGDPSPRR